MLSALGSAGPGRGLHPQTALIAAGTGLASPLPLSPPPPAAQILEHHLVTPACRHDLPIASTQRSIGPPAILDQPGLADCVHGTILDRQRVAVDVAGADGDATRDQQAARSGHAGLPFESTQIMCKHYI